MQQHEMMPAAWMPVAGTTTATATATNNNNFLQQSTLGQQHKFDGNRVAAVAFQ